MIRKAPASSMQKTYDECYLTCSTAIYFEGQNNEAEALRAWRNALDAIYYHNAYKMPSNYVPRTETEKALHDSLRAMELQCKERVDLLEALRKSRQEADDEAKAAAADTASRSRESLSTHASTIPNGRTSSVTSATTWLGNDTVPQTQYNDLPRPTLLPERRRPAAPPRPSYRSHKSSGEGLPRAKSFQPPGSPTATLSPPPAPQVRARTPSPEKNTEKKFGMLRTLRAGSKEKKTTLRPRPQPAATKAATQVWAPKPPTSSSSAAAASHSTTAQWDPYTRSLVEKNQIRDSVLQQDTRRQSDIIRPPSPSDFVHDRGAHSHDEAPANSRKFPTPYPDYPAANPYAQRAFAHSDDSVNGGAPHAPAPPPHRSGVLPSQTEASSAPPPPPPASLAQAAPVSLSYRKEYLSNRTPSSPGPSRTTDRVSDPENAATAARPFASQAAPKRVKPEVPRKAVRAAGLVSAVAERQRIDSLQSELNRRTKTEQAVRPGAVPARPAARNDAKREIESQPLPAKVLAADDSSDADRPETPSEQQEWDARVKVVMKKLPRGVDEAAAKQIFNEIVISGDEVHWDDVAGLDIAKSALKETVVYPFLRPDLFMGLREPARGMLLFGPPGTGKTMLARAVATESKSVFFAISASSLTSKYLGESEKLVRALFTLAKELAPSIIFVDEIDSLLGARGGGSEHEATRRLKTEFLIQWSDLQKAAAGRESSDGDASRVLVLAATNLPWAIDEAARRRFVRRQYIPLPEDHVREKQLRTLLSAQKHSLDDRGLARLVQLTDGFSGSDITALAKDAAMGPLRSLGEQLLHMSPDDIRPIGFDDFRASLVNIRPSVSKQGLKEFEDWAREFGERGG